MQNLLTLAERTSAPLQGAAIECAAVDPERGTVFTASVEASTRDEAQGLVTVLVHVELTAEQGSSVGADQSGRLYELVRIDTPALYRSRHQDHGSLQQPPPKQVVSLQYLSDGGGLAAYAPALCLVCAGGDIVLIVLPESLEDLRQAVLVHDSISSPDNALQSSVVGTIEQGIDAAAWSPDDELLTVITNVESGPTSGSEAHAGSSPKVLLMTKAFDVLSERALFTSDFGDDAPVDVGWGSRATQFHGSAGKAAAAAAAAEAEAAKSTNARDDPRGPATPDDDGRSRVSWRGDGAFFMVSALEPFVATGQASQTGSSHHRVIRTFGRDGNLSATSEPTVRGLTHVLAVKPTGNIIAASQRFGLLKIPAPDSEPVEGLDARLRLADGRSSRHDIIFFERNGLRHGQFSLREESETQPREDSSSITSWTREHAIRELAWNSDGSALAVHLSRSVVGEGGLPVQEDVIQVWTTGNYHWYLKKELTAASVGLPQQHSCATAIRWHPEAAHELYIAWNTSEPDQGRSTSFVDHRTFVLDTLTSSSSTPPHDAAAVSVTDGASMLLTSFRLQNIPPPMCSFHLAPFLNASPPATLRYDSVPIHVAWADVRPGTQTTPRRSSISILAVLYPNSIVLLYALCWGQMPRAAPQGARKFPTPIKLGDPVSLGVKSLQSGFQVAASATLRAVDTQSDKSIIDVELGVLANSQYRTAVSRRSVSVSLDDKAGVIISASEACVVRSQLIARLCKLVAVQGGHDRSGDEPLFLHGLDGSLSRVTSSTTDVVAQLPRFCPHVDIVNVEPLQGYGLSQSGHLYAIKEGGTQLLAQNATSVALASSFLTWTNTDHQVRLVPVQHIFTPRHDGGASALNGPNGDVANLESTESGTAFSLGRSVERGSRIVVAVPSSMSLVLQMPRGNLETICPRPMVLEVVRAALDRQRYGMAFRICRTHRLDLNILHDHDPTAFMHNLSTFIDQVKEIDYLNLFLTSIRDDDVTASLYKPITQSDQRPRASQNEHKVNRIASSTRAELHRRDQRTYINSILTAYVSMKPPQYEAALELLGQMRNEDPNLADEAVRYIIFLADADKLFDVALGTYDFALVLMVAQHAKRKDPREYLPFLRELRALEPIEYQRYRIDEHLGRRAKALKWLLAAGPEHHEDALAYMCKHNLYAEAIQALASQPSKLQQAHILYADHLQERNKHHEAALVYMVGGERLKALECFRTSSMWPDALALALEERLPASEVKTLARAAVDDYESKAKYVDAAHVCLDYERDVEQAVALFCKANEYSQARRLCMTAGRKDLLETTIKTSALETHERLREEIHEIRDQMEKQVARLGELREKKLANPAAFYVENDPALDNVDVMTDTSTQITQFTRYTSVPSMASMSFASNMTGSSHKSKKMKRKEERKKASGKKGSIYEEDYLFESLQKLLRDKLRSVQQDVGRLLPHLVVLSTVHRAAGSALQDALESLQSAAVDVVDKLWQAEQEQERSRAIELENVAAKGPEAWMAAYRHLVQAATGRRAGGRARLELASERWQCDALRTL